MYEFKTDYDKAIENYQLALGLNSNVQESIRRSYLLAIGRLYLKMGQYETSISSLD